MLKLQELEKRDVTIDSSWHEIEQTSYEGNIIKIGSHIVYSLDRENPYQDTFIAEVAGIKRDSKNDFIKIKVIPLYQIETLESVSSDKYEYINISNIISIVTDDYLHDLEEDIYFELEDAKGIYESAKAHVEKGLSIIKELKGEV